MLISEERIEESVKAAVTREQPDPQMWAKVRGELLRRPAAKRSLTRWVATAAVAAVVTLVAMFLPLAPGQRDLVLAMEQAVAQLTSFHGVIETHSTHPMAKGVRLEVWWDGDKYVENRPAWREISDGQQKWIIFEKEKQVTLRVPIGGSRHVYDLRGMADWAKRNPYKVTGEEEVLDRKTTRIEGAFPDGRPFAIWIDHETSLPIKFQHTWQNGITATIAYVTFEVNPKLDPSLFTFQIPEGWSVVQDQVAVASVEEAAAQLGFTPFTIDEKPQRLALSKGGIILDYGDTQIWQKRPDIPFHVDVSDVAMVGAAAGGLAVIDEEAALWEQGGLLVSVYGDRWLELGRKIAPDLTPPDTSKDLAAQAEVKVEVSRPEAEALQARADRGEKVTNRVLEELVYEVLGQTDETRVARPIPRMSAGNGRQAVVEMENGLYKRLYFERVVRNDITGLWFLVGYDNR